MKLRRALRWVLNRVPVPRRVITNDEGDPYLLRVYLTPDAQWWRRWLPGVYLHHFYRSDSDRELHNHPWVWALALILRGGYVEEYQQQILYNGAPFSRPWIEKRTLRPGSLNVITHRTFHRVELLDPERGAWSLFVAGPRFRDWGFVSRDGNEFETYDERERRIAGRRHVDPGNG